MLHQCLRPIALALVGAALALGGCSGESEVRAGGGDKNARPGSGGEMLAAADVERVLRARSRIAACAAGSDVRSIDGAVTTLISVYREGPDQIFQFGSSTRLGRPMSDVLAESRRGLTACGEPEAVARVERALDGDG